MLSAASSRPDRTLDMIRLVLLLETKQQTYPQSLKTYFNDVIRQTVLLLRRPSEFASEASAEAVSLALKASSNEALFRVIEDVLRESAITQEQAERVLETLEAPFDAGGESAYLSKEVYAAI